MLIQNAGQTLIIEWNVHQVAAAFFICFRVGKNFRLFAVKLIKILLHSWLERFLVWTCLNPSTSSKHTLWQHSARFPVPPATFCCPCCEGDSLHKTRQCTVIGQSTRCACTKTDLFKRRAAIQRNGFTATANFVFSCERACLSQTNRVLWKETKIGPAVPHLHFPPKKIVLPLPRFNNVFLENCFRKGAKCTYGKHMYFPRAYFWCWSLWVAW